MYNDRKKGASALPMQRRNTSLAQRTHREEDSSILKKVMISSLLGAGAAAVTGILLISISAAFAYSNPDPLALIPTLSIISLLPSNFIGGFVSAKRCGGSPLSCGAVCGALWCTLSLILALCFYRAPSSGYGIWTGVLLHGLSVLFCILGALAGSVKRRRSHKKRRFG